MFKIHDDKVYFVAETPDINKVIEIFLPKDDRGTIMDSHEIRVDLCRAVIHMEKKGVRVLKVRNIEDTNKASIDIWHMPEYQEAAESPVSDVVNACIESCFDSGAMFNLPCKANRKTHEVFAVECCASPDDDDSFSYAEVKINGKDYPINFIDDILLENNVDDALDEFYRIQQTGEYWQPDGNKTLDDAIHECRWAILKDAIQKRGHEAVADFVGTDISSDTYDRVMDETEAQMPDEEFERFWEKYIQETSHTQKGSILLWLFSIPTNFSAKPSARPSLVLLHFVRKQFVQTASPCRFRQAACTTAYRTKTCRTAITLRSNSATCLRRSKSFCRLLKTTRHRWLRSTGMCP